MVRHARTVVTNKDMNLTMLYVLKRTIHMKYSTFQEQLSLYITYENVLNVILAL